MSTSAAAISPSGVSSGPPVTRARPTVTDRDTDGATDVDRRGHGRAQPVDQVGHLVVAQVVGDDDELVAAEPRRRVAGPHLRLEPLAR